MNSKKKKVELKKAHYLIEKSRIKWKRKIIWININGTRNQECTLFNITISWQKKIIIIVICFNGNKVL